MKIFTKSDSTKENKTQVKENNKLPLPQKLQKISLVLSIAVALLGVAVLIGWTADIDVLKSGIPGLPGMKANAAISTWVLMNFFLGMILSQRNFYIRAGQHHKPLYVLYFPGLHCCSSL